MHLIFAWILLSNNCTFLIIEKSFRGDLTDVSAKTKILRLMVLEFKNQAWILLKRNATQSTQRIAVPCHVMPCNAVQCRAMPCKHFILLKCRILWCASFQYGQWWGHTAMNHILTFAPNSGWTSLKASTTTKTETASSTMRYATRALCCFAQLLNSSKSSDTKLLE